MVYYIIYHYSSYDLILLPQPIFTDDNKKKHNSKFEENKRLNMYLQRLF